MPTQVTRTLDRLIHAVGDAFAVLSDDLGSDDDAWTLFYELGLAFPPGLLDQSEFMQSLSDAATAAAAVDPLIGQLEAAIDAQNIGDIVAAAGKIVEAIAKLVSAADAIAKAMADAATGLGGPDGSATAEFAVVLAERLIGYLVIRYLEQRTPLLLSVLQLFALVSITSEKLGPDPAPAFYLKRVLQLEKLGDLLKSPSDFLRTEYGWGSDTFKGEVLLRRLRAVLQNLGAPVALETSADTPSEIDLWFFVLRPRLDIAPPGFEGKLEAKVADGLTLPLAKLGEHWTLELSLRAALDAGLGVLLQPPANLQLTSSSAVEGNLELALRGEPSSPDQPLVLFSATAGSALQAHAVRISFGAGFTWNAAKMQAAGEFELDAKVDKGQIVIKSTDPDSFIAKLLPADGLTIDFDFELGWTTKRGLYFQGGAGIETTFAIHRELGPITIESVHLAIYLGTDGLQLEVSVTADGSIGPISASIDRIGLGANLGFKRGNLGPVDLALGFKPPKGLGIDIDAGPITGGGFIEFDPANGRYAGVLALSLYSIQVKAIALLDTKLPNGESGYSFLVIISVEFTPIQLGFGFTLNGVGGLCGINRGFVTEALQAGLRAHSLDHILFPKDPIKNAPAIISDLRTIFPPAQGRYVFGPMLEIGWGGGANLLTAELGVLIALPSPVVIALLGQINVALPNPDAAIVELHLDVLGIIDFGKKLFSLDATLHDSRVAVFTIFGDMAMRLTWGDNPSFALAIGGFNPHFQPPPGFPSLKRLTIALSASDDVRLSIQTYLAITSNSFQVGARAELYVGVSIFNVYGWLGFDALFIFKPFSFIVDFTAGLALRSGSSTLLGISLEGQLSGPRPWHAVGEAHVTLLFFDIGVHVDITWGDPPDATDLPVVDAWPELQAAIQDPRSWSGALPSGVPAPVTLARPSGDAPAVLVDPSGVLTLRERVLPLNQTLTKFGEAVPGPQTRFNLDQILLGGRPQPYTVVRDKFAPAQFEQLSDQDKLSRPSFEDRDAGFSIGDGQLAFGAQLGVDLVYEDIYVDDASAPRAAAPPFQPSLDAQKMWARSNAAVKSQMRTARLGKYLPGPGTPDLVTLGRETFVVATTTDFTMRTDIGGGTTKGEAQRALDAYLSQHPGERGLLQVVPFYELAS